MKRYGKLYEAIYSIDNITDAHKSARKGKGHYCEVKMVDNDPVKYCDKIRQMLVNKTFKTSRYKSMIKSDSGKKRDIKKLPYFPDRIVHHCIVQVLEPIWLKTLVRDTYACIPGRGIHDGVKRVKLALRDKPNTEYCLKMDVKKFYQSVDHTVLKEILRNKIKDADLLWLLDEIIDSTDEGVPIGNYLSQHFGNLYLSGYDHWMKETQKCRYYFRYCDDVVVLDADKTRLHDLRIKTEQYWVDKLKLTLKGNWQIFPVNVRGIDFLGYRFFSKYTLLRKNTAKTFKRKLRKLSANWQNMQPVSVLSTVMSYEGWLRHANCLHLKQTYINSEIRDIFRCICKSNSIKNPLRRCVI
jgi:retron-type reverse transcriptase